MFGTATSDTGNGTTVKTNTNGSVGTVNSTNYTFVYYTDKGKYFHVKKTCSGMTNAKNASYASAVAAGKSACPTCAYALSKGFKNTKTDTATNGNNSSTTTANNGKATAESVVYIKTGKGATNYYHTAAKCSGQSFSNGLSVTLEYALNHNYKACPSCKPASKIST